MMISQGTSAYLQGRAFNEQGAEYTVRMLMDTVQGKSGKSSVPSIVIWKRAAAEGTPLAEIKTHDFNGSIQIR
ncbi:hypothetical protein ACFQI7_00420 [Paenibacillus allorhizosphaerae]|uniref:DUF3221 domain-containing protein n=1 Tax=Paenibacillus allorhizosphaerae TaxID=2849866 RepID=A0ABM8VA00_9BACL|nr:hypothetical protein [Paenibacillus allorhizosphaerae]CAG7614044.1 hypothetical protein PAECIP111802_00038 [Paenibacillus allorhizosphaerae]